MKKLATILGIIIVLVIGTIMLVLCNRDTTDTKQLAVNFEQFLEENYYATEKSDTIRGEIASLVEAQVRWKILSQKDDQAEVEISYPDIGTIFYQTVTTYGNNATSDEITTAMLELQNRLIDNTVEKKVVTVTTNIVDGVLNFNDEMVNAFSGGMLDAYTNIIDERMQEQIGEITE